MLSKNFFLNETKNHNPPLQVKWSVPYHVLSLPRCFGQMTFLSVLKVLPPHIPVYHEACPQPFCPLSDPLQVKRLMVCFGLWCLAPLSTISWRSVLLMGETGVPRENHRPVASHWQTLSHNVVSSTPGHERRLELTTSVVIVIDCTGTCKSKYHTIRTTTPLSKDWKVK